MDSRNLVRKLFTRLAESKDVYENEVRLIADLDLKVLSGGLTLDAGCGRGFVDRLLLAQAPQIRLVGVDTFFSDLLEATKHIPEGIMLVAADARELPFADSTFDQVISNQVIEHIAEYDQYLNELARVLKIGGRLVISTENADRTINVIAHYIFGWKRFLVWENLDSLSERDFRGHVREFTVPELRSALAQAGFRVIVESGIYPRFYRGNLWFKLYCAGKYLAWLLMRPFRQEGVDVVHLLAVRAEVST